MFNTKGYIDNTETIKDVLSKEDVKVEDVLLIEDVHEDVCNLNVDLINYFTKPDVFLQLLQIALTKMDCENDITQFRNPYVATECIYNLNDTLVKKLLLNKEIHDVYIGFLRMDELDYMKCGYFERITEKFVISNSPEFYHFLHDNHMEIIELFMKHFDRLSIMESFRYLMDVVMVDDTPWFEKPSEIMERVIEEISNTSKCDNLSYLLIGTIHRSIIAEHNDVLRVSIFLRDYLISEDYIERLILTAIKMGLHPTTKSIFDVLSRLFWCSSSVENHIEYGLGGESSCILADRQKQWDDRCVIIDDMGQIESVKSCVLRELYSITQLLTSEPSEPSDEGTDGVCEDKSRVLPSTILSIVGMLNHFFQYYKDDHSVFVSACHDGIVQSLLDLLSLYSYHTALHLQIVEIFCNEFYVNNQDAILFLLERTSFMSFVHGVVAHKKDGYQPLMGPVNHLLRAMADAVSIFPTMQSLLSAEPLYCEIMDAVDIEEIEQPLDTSKKIRPMEMYTNIEPKSTYGATFDEFEGIEGSPDVDENANYESDDDLCLDDIPDLPIPPGLSSSDLPLLPLLPLLNRMDHQDNEYQDHAKSVSIQEYCMELDSRDIFNSIEEEESIPQLPSLSEEAENLVSGTIDTIDTIGTEDDVDQSLKEDMYASTDEECVSSGGSIDSVESSDEGEIQCKEGNSPETKESAAESVGQSTSNDTSQ